MNGLFYVLMFIFIINIITKVFSSGNHKKQIHDFKKMCYNLLEKFERLDKDTKDSFLSRLSQDEVKKFMGFYTSVMKHNNSIQVKRMSQDLHEILGKFSTWLRGNHFKMYLEVFKCLKTEEKDKIFKSLDKESANILKYLLRNNNLDDINNMTSVYSQSFFTELMNPHMNDFFDFQQQINQNQLSSQQMNQYQQFSQHMIQQQQFNDFVTMEAFKSITPFDHDGYLQGNGFNPSDTMAFNSFNQMNNMQMEQSNQMNNMQMDQSNQMNDNNFGNNGMNGF